MIESILRIITDHQLIAENSLLIVGVSGGTDSLALLHLLAQLRDRLKFRLHAATLDHGLRGAEGVQDVQFVQEMAANWDIPCTVGHVDGHHLANIHGLSIETAARKARYDFLAGVAQSLQADRIAVGHHIDDQAETIFMHLLRGTGLKGLSGMDFQSPVPGYPDLTLIRPLLAVDRQIIEMYCQENDLHPREDLSNRDTRFLRNRVRLEIWPHLLDVNPQINQALIQLGDIVRVEQDYLAQQFNQWVKPHVTIEPGRMLIPRQVFDGLHLVHQREFVLFAVRQLTPNSVRPSYITISSAVDLARKGQVGKVGLLTGGLQLRVDYDTIVIEAQGASLDDEGYWTLPVGSEVPVQIPGITVVEGADWQLRVSLEAIEHAQARLSIPPKSRVWLRTRKPGDRFAPLGMEGQTRKLKKWMIDRKIPQYVRGRIPLLVINNAIAAILIGNFNPIADVFAVNNDETIIIYVRVEPRSM